MVKAILVRFRTGDRSYGNHWNWGKQFELKSVEGLEHVCYMSRTEFIAAAADLAAYGPQIGGRPEFLLVEVCDKATFTSLFDAIKEKKREEEERDRKKREKNKARAQKAAETKRRNKIKKLAQELGKSEGEIEGMLLQKEGL